MEPPYGDEDPGPFEECCSRWKKLIDENTSLESTVKQLFYELLQDLRASFKSEILKTSNSPPKLENKGNEITQQIQLVILPYNHEQIKTEERSTDSKTAKNSDGAKREEGPLSSSSFASPKKKKKRKKKPHLPCHSSEEENMAKKKRYHAVCPLNIPQDLTPSTKSIVLDSSMKKTIYDFYMAHHEKFDLDWILKRFEYLKILTMSALENIIENGHRGIFDDTRQLTPMGVAEMIEMVRKDPFLSYRKLMGLFGIKKSQVVKILKEHNIPRYTSMERRKMSLEAQGKEYTPIVSDGRQKEWERFKKKYLLERKAKGDFTPGNLVWDRDPEWIALRAKFLGEYQKGRHRSPLEPKRPETYRYKRKISLPSEVEERLITSDAVKAKEARKFAKTRLPKERKMLHTDGPGTVLDVPSDSTLSINNQPPPADSMDLEPITFDFIPDSANIILDLDSLAEAALPPAVRAQFISESPMPQQLPPIETIHAPINEQEEVTSSETRHPQIIGVDDQMYVNNVDPPFAPSMVHHSSSSSAHTTYHTYQAPQQTPQHMNNYHLQHSNTQFIEQNTWNNDYALHMNGNGQIQQQVIYDQNQPYQQIDYRDPHLTQTHYDPNYHSGIHHHHQSVPSMSMQMTQVTGNGTYAQGHHYHQQHQQHHHYPTMI